ncbi:hypothetical protein [Arthrobacter koreensis]|uniref:hypothetical protein n=1 Tax=Arthrobacter koreensis TaxID=199136 RepID=UPI00381515C2
MNTITSLASRAVQNADSGTPTIDSLPTAAWDLVSFLENAGEYIKVAGGAFLILVGLAALVWGAFLALKKLMGGMQNQDSWGKIIIMVILGGAIAVGGFSLVFTIGSGGRKTIEDLGGGTFLFDAIQPLGMFLGLG